MEQAGYFEGLPTEDVDFVKDLFNESEQVETDKSDLKKDTSTIAAHHDGEEWTEEELEEIERFKQFVKMKRGPRTEE
ncbi:XRE family transcriptional regulator [Paenibacillus phytohabitans]|uniref:XRE family transcriptional regulator n=1 Tax=Paenibacillus phytohabitans TaxID=2654978 RepID=UPI001FECE5BE|nr:XRE family transcriptional regulator [Paenibacillus phytohabitans]